MVGIERRGVESICLAAAIEHGKRLEHENERLQEQLWRKDEALREALRKLERIHNTSGQPKRAREELCEGEAPMTPHFRSRSDEDTCKEEASP